MWQRSPGVFKLKTGLYGVYFSQARNTFVAMSIKFANLLLSLSTFAAKVARGGHISGREKRGYLRPILWEDKRQSFICIDALRGQQGTKI